MKGTKTIALGDKEVKLRFDFGAVEDFCEELDIDFSGWQKEALQKPKNIRMLAYFMAKDHNEVEADEFRRMLFSDISEIMDLITDSTAGLEEQAGNAKKGKGKSK